MCKRHLPYHESDHVLGIAYNGVWGDHPLLVSLANTGEPLYVISGRGGCGRGTAAPGSGVPGDNFNRPSDVTWDRAMARTIVD